MPSTRETALLALFAALQTVPAATVKRNEIETQDVADGGTIVLRDGEAGEPTELMSPSRSLYFHRAEAVVLIEGSDAASRDAAMDGILQAIGVALDADVTLGGAVDLVEADAPEAVGEEWDLGSPTIKALIVPIILTYVTESPLG